MFKTLLILAAIALAQARPNEDAVHVVPVQSINAEDCETLANGCPVDFTIHKLIPHEEYCHLFYYCDKGELVLRSCAEPLYFDPESQVCVWSSQTDCVNNGPYTYPTTAAAVVETTTAPGTIDIGAVLDNGCPANFHIHHLLPHEECEKFYQCNFGQKVERDCAPGTVFHYEIQVCDWPRNVPSCAGSAGATARPQTTPAASSEEVPTPNDPEEWESRPNGCPVDSSIHHLLPHESVCDKYYACDNERLIEMRCAPGTHFSPSQQVCTWPHEAGCEHWIGGGGCPTPGDNGGSCGGSTTEPTKPTTPVSVISTTPVSVNSTTPAPSNTTTAAPGNTTTPVSVVSTTPAPSNTTTAAPDNATTPVSVVSTTPAPSNTTTAAPGNATTPVSVVSTTPAPNNTTTAAPGNATTPVSVVSTTPAPSNTTTAAPGNATTPVSVVSTTPAPSNTTTAAPGNATTPVSVVSTTPAPNNTTTAAPGNATTPVADNSTTPVADIEPTTEAAVVPTTTTTTRAPSVTTTITPAPDCDTEGSVTVDPNSSEEVPAPDDPESSATTTSAPTNAPPSCPQCPTVPLTPAEKCKQGCNVAPWAHPECDKFYSCIGNEYRLNICSEGLHFNPKSLTCDFICNAGCVRNIPQVTRHEDGMLMFVPHSFNNKASMMQLIEHELNGEL